MAVIEAFEPHTRSTFNIHRTKTRCRYKVFDAGPGKRVLQLDTYGSPERELADKVSQTLQFTEPQARFLWELLGREFRFSR